MGSSDSKRPEATVDKDVQPRKKAGCVISYDAADKEFVKILHEAMSDRKVSVDWEPNSYV
jgi:hypothetical protein